MRRSALVITMLVAAAAAASLAAPAGDAAPRRAAQTGGGRVALVIGNAAYLHHAPLRNPGNDAAGVSRQLGDLQFQVTHKSDLKRADMVQLIEDFGGRIGESEIALFYYAGHGVQVKGVNYLIPVDARITDADDIEREAVKVDMLFEMMQAARAKKLNLIILDACRDNPFRKLDKSKADFLRDLAPGLAPPRGAPAGTVIAYATDPGRVAADGNGRHSPYTRALLRYMPQPGLTLDNFFRRVREHVIENTDGRQTPWENSSITGDDFYFRPPAFVECKIDTADDEAYVYINDSPVLVAGGGTDWKRVQLNPGANSLEIKIYNQKTRRGVFGPREGWRYEVRCRASGQEKVFQDAEDNPPDERWGKTFSRVKTTIDVDENTGAVTVR